jgi:hypothetical protein
MDILMGLMMAGLGLCSISWAIFFWRLVSNDSKVRLLSKLLTPTGARVFYVLLGSFLVVFGFLVAIGVIRK